jgi:hypothetical protein
MTAGELKGSHFTCNCIKHIWKHYDRALLELYSEIKFTKANRNGIKIAIFYDV